MVDRNLSFDAHSSHTPTERQLTLSWSGVTAFLKQQDSSTLQERHLLNDVSGIAKPGQLLAIMGGSGAGKTTMLSIISGRLANSNVTVGGSIRLNGQDIRNRTDVLRRLSAFVEQDDVFPGFLTVGEHLWFHAKLRMTNQATNDEDRKRRIAALVSELNLTLVIDTLIGYTEMGMKTLSGGERKRLSIATELLANSPLLLLDEPTSGLDSFTSEAVISALHNLAQLGKTIVFTIHQPSSELFAFFDRLYLLSEGYCCFHGASRDAANFFESPPINRPCPVSYNPADFYIELISRPSIELNNGDQDDAANVLAIHAKFLNKTFAESTNGRALAEELKKVTEVQVHRMEEEVQRLTQPRASHLTQLQWLTWRAAKTFHRSPQWMRLRLGQVVAFSFILGLTYLNLSMSPADVMNRIGLAYMMMGLNCWDNIDAYAISIPYERSFLFRENQVGLYSLAAYFLGRQLVEIPLLFVFSVAETTIMALMSNFWSTTDALGIFVMQAATFLAGLAASSVGYVIGFMSGHIQVVITFRRGVAFVLVVFSGYYVNMASVAPYLKWMFQISLFYFGFESMMIAEWINVGELECPTAATSDSSSCYPSGQAILDYYLFGDMSKAISNLGILVVHIVCWRIIALMVLYYQVYSPILRAVLMRKFCCSRG